MKKILSLLALAVFIFNSCQKNSNLPPQASTKNASNKSVDGVPGGGNVCGYTNFSSLVQYYQWEVINGVNQYVAVPYSYTASFHGQTLLFSGITYETGAWKEGDPVICDGGVSLASLGTDASVLTGSPFSTFALQVAYGSHSPTITLDGTDIEVIGSTNPSGTQTYYGRLFRSSCSSSTLAVADEPNN